MGCKSAKFGLCFVFVSNQNNIYNRKNHILPVAGRIKFKLCLLMHLIHTGRAPQYLVDTVQSVTTSSRRHLRSSETTDYVKRTTRTKFGERGFSHSGPAARNSLPSHLRTIIDTNVFKRHLKAFLFTESFSATGQTV